MNKRFLLILLSIHLLIYATTTACSTKCTCHMIDAKQIADCTNQSLTYIPTNLPIPTRLLKFTGNNLKVLRDSQLSDDCELWNLEVLLLNRCNLKFIQSYAFFRLTDMIELDLSENLLNSVPSAALRQCPSLLRLNLSKNPIEMLNDRAFAQLKFLNDLDLEGCQIAHLDELSFSGLRNLRVLNLANNRIQYLREMTVFPIPLMEMQLQNNTWHCDCKIRAFRYWLQNEPKDGPYTPLCYTPEKFKGQAIKSLAYAEMECQPEISPQDFIYESSQMRNLTLPCKGFAGEESNMTWSYSSGGIETQPLPNNSANSGLGISTIYFTKLGKEQSESTLIVFNQNLTQNLTFFCTMETSTGKFMANYSIVLKPEEPDELDPLGLTIIFVLLIICIAIVIIVCHYIYWDVFIRECPLRLFKTDENAMEMSNNADTDESSESTKIIVFFGYCIHSLESKVKDVLGAFNRIEPANKGNISFVSNWVDGSMAKVDPPNTHRPAKFKTRVAPRSAPLSHIQVAPTKRHPKQPYLNPTLTANSERPISAPTFEKYIEGQPDDMLFYYSKSDDVEEEYPVSDEVKEKLKKQLNDILSQTKNRE